MNTLQEVTRLLREHQEVLARRYGVTVVGVFGSYVRGEERAESDLDLLVSSSDRLVCWNWWGRSCI